MNGEVGVKVQVVAVIGQWSEGGYGVICEGGYVK